MKPSTAITLAVLTAASLAGAPAPAAAQSGADGEDHVILPGYWSYTTSSLLLYNKTEQRCLRGREIDRVMSGAINRHYTCEYPTRDVGEGRLRMAGVCTDKKGRRYAVRMNGTYTPTRFHLDVRMGGLPASVEARRLSAQCPGGADRD